MYIYIYIYIYSNNKISETSFKSFTCNKFLKQFKLNYCELIQTVLRFLVKKENDFILLPITKKETQVPFEVAILGVTSGIYK